MTRGEHNWHFLSAARCTHRNIIHRPSAHCGRASLDGHVRVMCMCPMPHSLPGLFRCACAKHCKRRQHAQIILLPSRPRTANRKRGEPGVEIGSECFAEENRFSPLSSLSPGLCSFARARPTIAFKCNSIRFRIQFVVFLMMLSPHVALPRLHN